MPPEPHDTALDEIDRLHLKWKPGICRRVALTIIASMLTNGATWPDEIPLDFIEADNVNVIGSTWRRLAGMGLVEHTGQYRPSKTKRSNGRIVFQSKLVNRRLAELFIQRCPADAPELPEYHTQPELFHG